MNTEAVLEWRDDSIFSAPLGDLSAIKSIAEEYGFCLIKNVFRADEIESLVAAMGSSNLKPEDAPEPDLLSLPDLRWLLTDERILSIARKLLGPELVYYGETAANYEPEVGKFTLKPLMQLHADAMGTPKSLADYWQPTEEAKKIYPAYRFAIYTRDYSYSSGGLKVVPQSHLVDHNKFSVDKTNKHQLQLSPEITVKATNYPFGFYNIPSQPGDVVIWNLHTLHSAGALRLYSDPKLAISPNIEAQLWKKIENIYLPEPGTRNAIFFDYARPSQEIDLYIKSRAIAKCRKMDALVFKSFAYDGDKSQELFAKHGINPRFDAVITALALFLIFEIQNANGNYACVLSPSLAPFSQRLVNTCRLNTEFSDHFRLFDRAVLDDPVISVKQVCTLLDEIYKFFRQVGLLAPISK